MEIEKKFTKLENGTHVNCKWRDENYHKCEIIDSREGEHGLEYYVHYLEFNRRLDEWTTADKVDFSTTQHANEKEKKKKLILQIIEK